MTDSITQNSDKISKLLEAIEKLTSKIDGLDIHQTDKNKNSKKKNQSEPKRPPNGYFLFSQDHREKVKSENPELKGKDIVIKLGKMWDHADEKTKQKYENKALELKNKYYRDMVEYKKNRE
jgi:hypothetical protein